MCKRIGPEAMLRPNYARTRPPIWPFLKREEMKQILVANNPFNWPRGDDAARAFAMEVHSVPEDWSDSVVATRHIPVQIFFWPEEDPTVDIGFVPKCRKLIRG